MLLHLHHEQHLPLREYAASRTAISFYPAGSPEEALAFFASQAGCFSIASMRDISYGTTLCLRHPHFHSLEQFTLAIADIESMDEFVTAFKQRKGARTAKEIKAADKQLKLLHRVHICTPLAYSKAPNVGRNIKLAEKIWKVSAQWPGRITPYFKQGLRMPWDKALTWATTCGMPQMGGKGKVTLTAYLFVADLVYAGLVTMPSPSEVGQVIWDIKRGGYAGLRLLGLVLRPGDSTRAAAQRSHCITAFEELYGKMVLGFGPGAIELGLDPILLEHSLCKYSRFTNKRLTTIPADVLGAEAQKMLGRYVEACAKAPPPSSEQADGGPVSESGSSE